MNVFLKKYITESSDYAANTLCILIVWRINVGWLSTVLLYRPHFLLDEPFSCGIYGSAGLPVRPSVWPSDPGYQRCYHNMSHMWHGQCNSSTPRNRALVYGIIKNSIRKWHCRFVVCHIQNYQAYPLSCQIWRWCHCYKLRQQIEIWHRSDIDW